MIHEAITLGRSARFSPLLHHCTGQRGKAYSGSARCRYQTVASWTNRRLHRLRDAGLISIEPNGGRASTGYLCANCSVSSFSGMVQVTHQ
jgi:hypothetical protein